MLRVVKTELVKLKRYFIFWIGASLMLLTVLLTLFTSMAEDGIVWDYPFLWEQVVKNLFTLTFPMCIALVAGYMIDRETKDDTLKNIVTVPVSFRKLMAGKLIVAGLLSVLLGAVCYGFTVAASLLLGYEGLRWAVVPGDLLQGCMLTLLLYITVLPIVIAASRLGSGFLAGVILAFVYGFIGMFAKVPYPTLCVLGLVGYRSGAEGVYWNKPLCGAVVGALALLSVLMIGCAQKPGDEKRAAKKGAVPKKGW